ncbi:zinc metallochaperone AztD [Gordonia sp. (in: high G+C Gram-positive bacteria)]|uniref:zinc metallochaperone AztD n=1 Tax=Gordonia sp. (in: high G+C Gram-positive bacteria) TaxID=84139 RepID=UPI003F958AF6
MQKLNTRLFAAFAVAGAALLAACSGESEDNTSSPSEKSRATPRLVVSYDGGVRVLDGKSLEEVSDIDRDGFLRLNPAGDSRHVFVSTDDGFEVLDTGTWRESHGDHSHYFTAEPRMTDIEFDGPKPGHVVAHDDTITLFFDGSGEVTTMPGEALSDGQPETSDYRAPQAHHGVAVKRADGTLVVSRGDEDSRNGVAIIGADGEQITANDQCPGIHGEAAAAGGVLTFGCEDGVLLVRGGGEITKVPAPDAYARIGNQAGDDDSPFVLGDYKTVPDDRLDDDEIERPRKFSLTDTRSGTLRVVDLPTSYSFRSLARGQDGEAVILGTDGALYVFDPATGRQVARHQVIGAWTEPVEWQEPMPLVEVLGGTAYVSDPSTDTVVAVDVLSGTQVARTSIDVDVSEVVAVAG